MFASIKCIFLGGRGYTCRPVVGCSLPWMILFTSMQNSGRWNECLTAGNTIWKLLTFLVRHELRGWSLSPGRGSIPDRGKIIFYLYSIQTNLWVWQRGAIILHHPVSQLRLFLSYGAWLTGGGEGEFTCYLCYVYVYLWNVGLWYEQFVCSVRKEINSYDIVGRCGVAMIVLTSPCNN